MRYCEGFRNVHRPHAHSGPSAAPSDAGGVALLPPAQRKTRHALSTAVRGFVVTGRDRARAWDVRTIRDTAKGRAHGQPRPEGPKLPGSPTAIA